MRGRIAFGLVAGGAISRSFLMRHPWLEDGLGPVTAVRHRLASRIANTLRAGYPVANSSGLQDCRTVLFAVPDDKLAETAAQIATAFEWRGRHAIVCEGSSIDLRALRERGAECAGLRLIAGLPGWIAVEGDRRARRTASLFAEAAGARVVDLAGGAEAVFEAGVAFAGGMVPPLLEAARRCLRKAGIHESDSRKLTEAVCAEAIRNYWFSGGKAASPQPLTKVEREALGARAAGLERYYRASASGLDDVFGEPPRKRAAKASG